ncbi:hypothetical protein JX265_007664 [Neoarthrinium moseri]|uniref:Uncharacterized protein n=1 Tax=Neoarthrinium moseri TaxID=1658444 RepID=A0A9Q0ANJ0_9PEZI|nr:hypothetical protein JX265_007664 [Neoarthrinium moseri]
MESSTSKPWVATHGSQDDKFLAEKGYRTFLRYLKGADGLLEQELASLKGHGTNTTDDSISTTFLPYSLEGWNYGNVPKNPVDETSNLGAPFFIPGEWGYLEVGYRLRMLWRCLFKAALDIQNNGHNMPADENATYIHRFFKFYGAGLDKTLFSTKVQKVLVAHQ